MEINDLIAHDHQTISTAPSRPRKYLSELANGGQVSRLPHSCTLIVHKNIAEVMAFTARSLKCGSGVKTIYDQNFQLDNFGDNVGNLTLICDQQHPDYDTFAAVLRKADEQNQKLGIGRPDDVRWGKTIVVQDSMESELLVAGDAGIIWSWELLITYLKKGWNVTINLSNLRPSGNKKSDGFTASGPASFAEIYISIERYAKQTTMGNLLALMGVLNSVILRGGFKRGIVTSMMDVRCGLIEDYLNVPTAGLEGSHKKGVIVTEAVATAKRGKLAKLRAKIIEQVNSESIFLQKASDEIGGNYVDAGEPTYSNVCVGIMLPDRGTCLIWRVNVALAQTEQDLVKAFALATEQAVTLHKYWHDNIPKHLTNLWKPASMDRQIGLDILGLANLLAQKGIKYAEFIEALAEFNATGHTEKAKGLPMWFANAYRRSTVVANEVAERLGLEPFIRVHTIEPAQAHAFELTDLRGKCTCRGIWPPFSRIVTRMSETQESVTVNHGRVETVAEVGPANLFQLNSEWQKLMNAHGLPHSISMDSYGVMDEGNFQRWWESPLLTQYYQFAQQVEQEYARKRVEVLDVVCDIRKPGECSVCAE